MGFYSKLKWVLGILLVFILIVTTNLIDRNNFIRVREAVSTIYEDRLVAKNLIFEMLKSVQEKELAVATTDSVFFEDRNSEINNRLNALILKFEQTKLTKEEKTTFKNLKKATQSLLASEAGFVQNNLTNSDKLLSEIDRVKSNLDDLSQIQLEEGNRQMSIGKRAVDTVELFTQIEIYLLVFLAIVIQIIVMYNPKSKTQA